MNHPKRSLWAFALIVGVSLNTAPPAAAFTQSGVTTPAGSVLPMGHEWLTRRAAIELLLATDDRHLDPRDPLVPSDPNDPRRSWLTKSQENGFAKSVGLGVWQQGEVDRIKSMPYKDDPYGSTYKLIFDAIIGERWVDLGGFNVSKSRDCFNAVAQQPALLQYDHFLRQSNDTTGAGGLNASVHARSRFRKYFQDAAMALPAQILVWDGGTYSAQYSVDYNYFLFGRAVHVFQDSFSLEHTVRIPDDNYKTIRQVKSYQCTMGSEQHSHDVPTLANYAHGDVIWNPGTNITIGGWKTYIPSNMKPNALVALEATKDLWAAFIRTMATPRGGRAIAARDAAEWLDKTWLAVNETEVREYYYKPANKGVTYVGSLADQNKCLSALHVQSLEQLVKKNEEEQKACLFNVRPVAGYSDLNDPSMHMPFNWTWTNPVIWSTPPKDWKIPADQGAPHRLWIESVKARYAMTGTVADGTYVSVYSKVPQIEFIKVKSNDPVKPGAAIPYYFRTAEDPRLFLSYSAVGGQVKLWDPQLTTDPTSENTMRSLLYTLFSVNSTYGYWAIKNQLWGMYLWADKNGSVYVTNTGDANESHSQWVMATAVPGDM